MDNPLETKKSTTDNEKTPGKLRKTVVILFLVYIYCKYTIYVLFVCLVRSVFLVFGKTKYSSISNKKAKKLTNPRPPPPTFHYGTPSLFSLRKPTGVRPYPPELHVRDALQPLRGSGGCGGAVPLPADQASPCACRFFHGDVVDIGGAVLSRPALLPQAGGACACACARRARVFMCLCLCVCESTEIDGDDDELTFSMYRG